MRRAGLVEAWEMAWRSLRIYHVRGALTCAGLMIGVGAMIVIAGLGAGMREDLVDRFGPLATQIEISPEQQSQPGVDVPPRDLTTADVAALNDRSVVPDAATVTPVVTDSDVGHVADRYASMVIEGSSLDYLSVTDRRLATGRWFSPGQARTSARVVVLGPQLVARLFGGDDRAAVGNDVRIARTGFRVIGTLEASGQNDAVALMPTGTARTYVAGKANRYGKIVVTTASTAAVVPAVDEITRVLSARHHISDPLRKDFTVKSQPGIVNRIDEQLFFVGLFILGAASICLVVGGVGIANIMLVSVAERTREIGIRRAVGARRDAILKQFLLEASVIAGVGGLSGVIIGIVMTLAAHWIVPLVGTSLGVPQLSPLAIVVAFLVSVVIGVVAGIYPARRACQLQPIDVLRHE
jgi:putative ABC transport system permease protein